MAESWREIEGLTVSLLSWEILGKTPILHTSVSPDENQSWTR